MMKNKIIKILWIPGLGSSEVMYIPLIKELNKNFKNQIQNNFFYYYDVPPYLIKSLDEYIVFLYKKNYKLLKQKYDIAIGCSLGGMVLQILLEKRKVNSQHFIFLSTALQGDDLTILAKYLAKFLYTIPIPLRKLLQNIVSFSYRIFRFYLKEVIHFSNMFKNFPTNVFFEAPYWILKWKGISTDILLNKNMYFIHGTFDPLISFKKVYNKKKLEFVIKKGSHIIFSTHSQIIGSKIHEWFYMLLFIIYIWILFLSYFFH